MDKNRKGIKILLVEDGEDDYIMEELIKKHEELKKLFRQIEIAKEEWEGAVDCLDDMIILTDMEGKIKRINRAVKEFINKPYEDILGKNWEELVSENELEILSLDDNMEIRHQSSGKSFVLNSYPIEDRYLNFSGHVITIHDVTEIKNKTKELESAYAELKTTQSSMLQREKMASIGQLAAGVAHEINNPMGFISSNLCTLDKYINRFSDYINAQTEAVESFKSAEVSERLKEMRNKLKLDYILKDIRPLIEESEEGAERVKKIVQNLRTFSRVDESECKSVDIHECIESTLNIVWNELKYKTTVIKDYGKLPLIRCYPQQLNQVFMNLLVNAAQAIENQGEIKIKTWRDGGTVNISISDTGCGIPQDKINRVFEPFFTTKEVGKGTGLGLSISYDIVKKHNGEITVESEVGKGTSFTVMIPFTDKKEDPLPQADGASSGKGLIKRNHSVTGGLDNSPLWKRGVRGDFIE